MPAAMRKVSKNVVEWTKKGLMALGLYTAASSVDKASETTKDWMVWGVLGLLAILLLGGRR